MQGSSRSSEFYTRDEISLESLKVMALNVIWSSFEIKPLKLTTLSSRFCAMGPLIWSTSLGKSSTCV